MTKKTLLLLISIFIITFISVFTYLNLSKKEVTQEENTTTKTNFLADFLPFGKKKTENKNQNQPIDIGQGETNIQTNTQEELQLTRISPVPVSGFGIFNKERFREVSLGEKQENTIPYSNIESATSVRYVEKATGYVYQTFLDKLNISKITTTIIPKTEESYFGDNGNSVIMRYLKGDNKTIETFAGEIPTQVLGGDTARTEIKGSFLPENIKDLSISSNGSELFYISNTTNTAVGTISGLKGNNKTQIFNSPFTEWLSTFPNERTITLTTKPSSVFGGYMYFINRDKKDFQKILGNINGLTTLTNESLELVAYSDNTLSLNLYNTKNKTINKLGIRTLSEKCVWSKLSDYLFCAVPKFIPNLTYPDSWYQGDVSFGDQIWKIDTANNTTTLLVDPFIVAGGEMDIIRMTLDEKEENILFINKKDSYLWKLDLNAS